MSGPDTPRTGRDDKGWEVTPVEGEKPSLQESQRDVNV